MRGGGRQRGENQDNCNSIINKNIIKKIKMHVILVFIIPLTIVKETGRIHYNNISYLI